MKKKIEKKTQRTKQKEKINTKFYLCNSGFD